MLWIVMLGVACIWLIGGMVLEDIGVLDRWARRSIDRKLRDRRSGQHRW